MLALFLGEKMKKQQGKNMETNQIPAKQLTTNPTNHIFLVKPLKDNKSSKSEALKAKGGEGCLPIR